MAEPDSEAFILEFLNSREGLELNRAFVEISIRRCAECRRSRASVERERR